MRWTLKLQNPEVMDEYFSGFIKAFREGNTNNLK
jgi:hypothetical protein